VVRLAVTPPEFDDMGEMLRQMGEGFQFSQIAMEDLQDPRKLAGYDVLFLTCAQPTELTSSVKESLREFVSRGGTLYASDLRFDWIAKTFPEFVDRSAESQGKKGEVTAEVLDSGLRDLLGPALRLRFDKDEWRPAAFGGEKVTVYLKARIETMAKLTIEAPLLVKFAVGEGLVVFTSFHNEKQGKETPEKLLRYLVLTTITAKLQEQMASTLRLSGFAPQQQNTLLTNPRADQPVTGTYENKARQHLRFTLGLGDAGAQMQLGVHGPNGETFEQEGESTLAIDIPAAAPGTWHYTVHARKVPYPNFPVTYTVSAIQEKRPEAPTPEKPKDTTLIVFKEVRQEAAPPPPRRLRLAVTRPQWDDMGRLLDKLGEGFKYTQIAVTDLLERKRLADFDVVFVTCSMPPVDWVAGAPLAKNPFDWKPSITKTLQTNLRDFVGKGGILYASDWHLPLLKRAFPEFFDLGEVALGRNQDLEAEIVDPGLAEAVGSKRLSLHFDLENWFPATLKDEKTATIYLRGEYHAMKGGIRTAPLLVKVPYEKGAIIFTSFHNEKANGPKELVLLKHLVFNVVTAKVQATVNKAMARGGFSPRKQSTASHSAGNPTVTQKYTNPRPARLQFALGLAGEGARLQFIVRAPNGQEFKKEVTANFAVEVPNAPAGEWQYTVTALSVPYENFPFTVNVGEAEDK
jgi:hypothetical protein